MVTRPDVPEGKGTTVPDPEQTFLWSGLPFVNRVISLTIVLHYIILRLPIGHSHRLTWQGFQTTACGARVPAAIRRSVL
jgi:hypothetical protein